MVVLEELGYLKKEYFSSGKIPTKLGYKFYIDNLMEDFSDEKNIREKLSEIFKDRHSSVDQIMDKCAVLVSEFLNLPTVLVKKPYSEYLRKIDIVNLEDNKHVIYLVTSSGRIVKDLIVLEEEIDNKREDLMASIRLLNEKLLNCPLNKVNEYIHSFLPILRQKIHQFEFIYETIISQMIIKKLLTNISEKPKIYNTKSLIYSPEIQKKDIDISSLFELLEKNSVFSPVNYNYLKTGKTLFNLDEADGLSIATTSIDINFAQHKLSVVGPIRMNYPLIKYLFDFLNEKLSLMNL